MWEPAFLLQYYLGTTWHDYYNMPVTMKRWMIERVVKELNKSNEKGESPPTKALHQNTPEARELMGMARSQVPSRLRRFT